MNILYIDGNRGTNLALKQGYYTHITQMILALRKQGNKVVLLSISEPANIPELNNKDLYLLTHKYIRLIHKFLPFTGLYNSLRILYQATKLHKQYKFDLIHDRFGLYSFGGILFSKLKNIPLLLEINGPVIEEKPLFTEPINGLQLEVAKLLRKFCLNNATEIYVVSKIVREYVEKWGCHKNIHIIPNAVNKNWFNLPLTKADIRKKLNWKKKSLYITYTGSLHVWYDLITLLKVFKQLKDKNSSLNLNIIGNGQQEEELKKLSKDCGLSDKTHFVGFVERQVIQEYLLASDILIAPYKELPTGFFNSPIKLFEYMASGTPLVASNIGQIPEIITHNKNGLLYTSEDEKSLYDSLKKLIDDSKLRDLIGKNAQQDVLNNYTWDHVATKLSNIYSHITKSIK